MLKYIHIYIHGKWVLLLCSKAISTHIWTTQPLRTLLKPHILPHWAPTTDQGPNICETAICSKYKSCFWKKKQKLILASAAFLHWNPNNRQSRIMVLDQHMITCCIALQLVSVYSHCYYLLLSYNSSADIGCQQNPLSDSSASDLCCKSFRLVGAYRNPSSPEQPPKRD